MIAGLADAAGGGGGGPSATGWRINFTAADGSNLVVAEVEMRQTAGGADECTGGTASAQDSLFGAAANAFANDGATTFWGTNFKPAWLKYTFATPKTIEEISLTAAAGNFASLDMPQGGDVQYDSGGGVWVTYWSFITGPFGLGETRVFNRTDPVPTGKRWWRMYVTALAGGGTTRLSCSEMDMRLTHGGADQCSGGHGFSRGKLSTLEANNAFANDGATTFFAENGDIAAPVWLGYAFPADVDITELWFQARSSFASTESPGDFLIQYGAGASWTTVHSVSGETSWTGSEIRTYSW